MISMTYRREIELVFDISAFGGSATSLKIDLWYIADSRDTDPLPRTAEKEFFVQCIRNHVCTLAPGRTTVSDVLGVVRLGWDKATKVSSQIKRVNTSFPTTVSKTSDTSVAVCSSLLLVPLATRVEVILNLHGRNSPQGIVVGISPEARVIYGEHFNVSKIGEFLSTKLGETVTMGPEEVWSDVAVELHERLIARGKKA
jgi:kinetochore protein Spc7/SPC105